MSRETADGDLRPVNETVSWRQSAWTKILLVVLCAALVAGSAAMLTVMITDFEDFWSELTPIGYGVGVLFFGGFFLGALGGLRLGVLSLGHRGFILRCTPDGLDMRSFSGATQHMPWSDILDAEIRETFAPRVGVIVELVLSVKEEAGVYRQFSPWERRLAKISTRAHRLFRPRDDRRLVPINLNPVAAEPDEVLRTVQAFRARHGGSEAAL